MYQFAMPTEPSHGEIIERLLSLSGYRAGRLLLAEQLRRGERGPGEGPKEARLFVAGEEGGGESHG